MITSALADVVGQEDAFSLLEHVENILYVISNSLRRSALIRVRVS